VQPEAAIEATGTLTFSDLARFHYFHSLRRTWWIGLLAMVMPPATVAALFLTGATVRRPGVAAVETPVWPFLILPAVSFLAAGVLPYWRARRQYRSQTSLRDAITYTFRADAIGGQTRGASWQIGWDRVHKLRETKSLFLLYQSSKVAVLVPKRFFRGMAEMERWRALAEARTAPKGIEKPGVAGRWC